ncbi:hypothetical protein ACLOJK_033385 [Asimina triloba]
MPQSFKTKLREIGMLRLMPSTLALRAVHRHKAASRFARPWIREQHGSVGGDPTTTFTNPSKLAQTPSFKASLGHLPREGVGVGVGRGLGGLGLQEHLLQRHGLLSVAVAKARKRRFRQMKRAADAEFFEAISKHPCAVAAGACINALMVWSMDPGMDDPKGFVGYL